MRIAHFFLFAAPLFTVRLSFRYSTHFTSVNICFALLIRCKPFIPYKPIIHFSRRSFYAFVCLSLFCRIAFVYTFFTGLAESDRILLSIRCFTPCAYLPDLSASASDRAVFAISDIYVFIFRIPHRPQYLVIMYVEN